MVVRKTNIGSAHSVKPASRYILGERLLMTEDQPHLAAKRGHTSRYAGHV